MLLRILGRKWAVEGMSVCLEEACDVHFSGLCNFGFLLPYGVPDSQGYEYHVCFSPAMIAALSGLIALRLGGKVLSSQSSKAPFPQSWCV